MSITYDNKKKGRLCNQIIRNLALNFLAIKHDLQTVYSKYDIINNKLRILLYIGKNKYNKTNKINNLNYIKILNSNNINFNLDLNDDFFKQRQFVAI